MKAQAFCLSPSEASKRLGLGRTKFYALLKAKQIPHLRVGRRILIPVKELEQWLHEQTNVKGGELLGK